MGSGVEDQQRDRSVYLYLLNCLTDIEIQEKDGKKRLNEASIAKQWGMTKNRVFVQRVLRSTSVEYYKEDETTVRVPGLTLNRLVKILAALEDYWQKKRAETSGSGISRIITREEKLKAISKFSQLSFEEREEIDLSIGFIESLHQQLFETITHPVTGIKTKNIVPLYNNIFDIISLLKEKSNIDDYESLDEYITCRNKFIEKFIDDLIAKNFYEKSDKSKLNKKNQIERISKKVKREINRIEFQSGFAELKKNSTYQKSQLSQNDSHLLPFSFIKDLAKAVTENQIITDIFPVSIQHFEIEKTEPLPLYIDNEKNNGLLNPFVLQQDLNEESQGLETQFAYKVKVYFRVNLAEGYEPKFEQEFNSISNDDRESLEFFEESTGIGSIISLIIAAINKLLLWDIPILNEYLPIAQEVLSQDKPIYESVQWPVFSSALIKLCRKEDLEKSLLNNKNYNQVANDQEIVRGEYCGFDLIETAAKAALYARLRAIKQTGIDSSIYISQLCHKIEEQNVLKQAEKYLYSYPFSLKAMEGYLNQTILPQYRTSNKNFEFKDIYSADDQLKHWSLVAYDAHLTLAKAYLQEGLYRIGKNFLDVIKPHMDDEEFQKGISSDLIRAKYELCQFRYYYLIDTQDLPENISDRTAAIRNTLERLDKAEECLKQNSSKYHIISQSSQSNFYPFFHFLSRVYSHRAKLCMFFPSYYFDLSNKQNNNNSVIDAISLFERARIYAARDGNAKEYSYWTAYQSWCYFIAAYLKDDYQLPSKFSLKYCLSWAKKLIDDALICYSATGKLCYQQIKDNGGNITAYKQGDKFYESYGKNQISVIPLIQELSADLNNSEQGYDSDKNILSFDISILKSVKESRYLFGTSSSIILFSMGMRELCEEQENNEELKTRIETAITTFTYCSLIAGDGGVHNELCTEEKLYIDRIFDEDKDGYSLLRGLYPHRISQFADFGKVFVATCKAILILSGDNQNTWEEEVHTLLKDLHHMSDADSQYALEQKRYNGHLANHFDRAKNYFKSLEEENKADNLSQKNRLEIRNIIVKNIFRIMQGKDFK